MSVSVLTFNVFLIPSWFVNKANASCANQEERALGVGQLASQFDVVQLQEVWGSNTGEIERSLQDFEPYYESWGNTALDSLWGSLKAYGGLYSAFRKSRFTVRERARYTYSVSCSRSRKGVMAACLGLDDGRTLVTFNTHLDPAIEGHRIQEQLHEARMFVEKCLLDWVGEEDRGATAVIFTGDFNSDRGSALYDVLLDTMGEGMRDLMSECSTHLPPTYDGARNKYAMWGEDERLDYIFSFDSVGGRHYAHVTPSDLQVHDQFPLSDHWAVSMTINWNQ